MPSDFSAWKTTPGETSSSAKFDGFVQAVQDAINGITTAAVSPAQITGYPSDATKFLSGVGTWVAPLTEIRGRVSGAGAIIQGTGFTVVRNSTGHYTVTFGVAFAAAPNVQVTATNTSGPLLAIVDGAAVGSFRVSMLNVGSGSADTDSQFDFRAVAY